MKILVTGSAGFIGYHLSKRLLERGDEVIGIDNLNDYYDPALKKARLAQLGIDSYDAPQANISKIYDNYTFMKMDIADNGAMQRLFEESGFDAVCHLAAQAGVRYSLENPHAYIESNVKGFLNILEGCRQAGVNNLSYASSSSIYGLNQKQPFSVSDHTDHPVSIYAATKKANEMMAHTYAHLYGIGTTGLRFFTVYGPWGRPDMAPMLFADAMMHNREIKVFNHGKMSRDFTYVDDIVTGIVKVIDNPARPSETFDPTDPDPSCSSAPYRLYNIGNNAPVGLMAFIETMEATLGKEAKKRLMPMQDGDVVSTYADVTPLMEDFGYRPKTTLQEGVEKFVEWYRSFYGSDR